MNSGISQLSPPNYTLSPRRPGRESWGEGGQRSDLGTAHLTLPAANATGRFPLPPVGWRGVNRKAFSRTLPSELCQTVLRRHPLRDRLLGIFVAQFVEAEAAAFGDFEAALDRVLMAAKPPRHLLRRFQIILDIGGEAISGFCDRAAFADTRQHILQSAALGQMVEHVVDRDERQPGCLAESSETGEALHIIAAIEMVRGKISTTTEIRRDAGCGLGGQGHHNLTLAVRDDIGVVEMTFAFGRAALAEGQKSREPAIGGAIRGVGEKARAVAQIEAAPDDEANPNLLCRMMRAHDAGKAVDRKSVV